MSSILKFILVLGLSLASLTSVFSQEKYMIAYEKEGDEAMKNGEYEQALNHYQISRKFFKTPLGLYFKMGEACRMAMDYDKAEYFYQKVITEGDSVKISEEFPELYFNLTDVSISNGNIFIAQDVLQKLLTETKDTLLIERAKKKLNNIEWIIDNNRYVHGTNVINLGRNVNNESSQASNFVLGDSVLFISNISYTTSEKNGITYYNDAYQQIFKTRIDSNNNCHSPIEFLDEKEINKKKKNISNICFDQTNQIAYFTRSNAYNNEVSSIYYSTYENGKYQKAKKLNKKINIRGYSNTQPHIAVENGEKILYFSSNREGGFGGYDLYYYILDGKDNEVINLGPTINTEGDEITPFYSQKGKSLYFSSNYHLGFGGFDIFKAEGWATRWREPENQMQPINSPANDLYPVIVLDDELGYFTSNREGSFSSKNKTCCNDIYRFEADVLPKTPTMEEIKNKSSFSPLFDLPLQVFFHNDQPDPQTNSTKTKMDYAECFKQYKSLSNIYKAEATNQITDSTENTIIDSIDSFFSIRINKGMDKLNNMCDYLLSKLKQGEKLNLSIIGYSSSLHNEMYNFALSERRIGSIINYMMKWNGGELNYYLTSKASDSIPYLNIKTLPMGKIGSKSGNPKSIIERRRLIYNIDAMFERRVEIKLIEIR
ncbi:MAG: hypothetical protein WC135_07990 [Bacteroidales bacterium]